MKKTRFHLRRARLALKLREAEIDFLLVTSPANWYYLTEFTGEAGALVVSPRRSTLITDGRFVTQGREETTGIRLVQHKRSLFQGVGDFLRGASARRVGFDPAQLTVARLKEVRKAAGKKCRLVPAQGLVENLRRRKDATELAQMRKAAMLAGKVLEEALGMLRPGIREFELGAEIDYQMRKRGASGPAFETIVAFGERGALPHARPTFKRLRKNELVVLDLGVILGHYCSDITRTVFVGRAPRRVREWYRAVLDAQAAAIATARGGASCGQVDKAARLVLAKHHLDRLFVHSTGHGLGLEVHEDPRVARGQKTRLEPGNVITIEPGVYAEGIGGIRIEDDVAVEADGAEVLTRVQRDFIEL